MTRDASLPNAFAVHAFLEGCVAEVLLNDVPLVATDGLRLQASVHATPWVVDGVNELRVVVTDAPPLTILPMGAVAEEPPGGAVTASALVMTGFYEDLVPDPERDPTVVDLVWGPADAASRVLPATVGGTFVAKGRPRWAWQDAPVLDPVREADRQRVLAFVREIHASFAAGDGAAVAARFPALAREDRHFTGQPRDLAAAFAGELGRIASGEGFALASFADEDVLLRPIAGGRMLRVLGPDGASLIRSAPEMERTFLFRLDVALLDGTLQLARLG